MYSEADIDDAVTAGALSSAAAGSFRGFVALRRATTAADEEQFRLITGFNDIFVAIAIVLLLVAMWQVGDALWPPLSGLAIAATAWGLAEYFTRIRRMALPSILLLLAFAGGVAWFAGIALFELSAAMPSSDIRPRPGFDGTSHAQASSRLQAVLGAVTAAVTVGATWLHWRRFQVPITIAAGAAAVVGVAVSIVIAIVPSVVTVAWAALLVGGLGLFAFAMRWDLSDRERRTRRADVAFWLHLAAAPMIAHSLFNLLGVFEGDMGIGTAAVVLVLYVAFAVVALATDRRALLVSGLAYVLYAMAAIIRQSGAVELSAALTALVIGSALLSLSAFWQTMRQPIVAALGAWGRRLPPAIPPPAS
ncbi:hypothetical protein [Sphingomonas sp. Leaf343]|uniref:hypothetical protein n=1 Tax=Sphingomonas sp. Leaf343 TaxID=1736345 RepID=UPI0006FC7493|nr:hypothetical protein [Sphingomonas sp. Leaf343]KQR83116.1 hypothetical protein ASG07_09070 [Sphingomonas sp. Leaf343]